MGQRKMHNSERQQRANQPLEDSQKSDSPKRDTSGADDQSPHIHASSELYTALIEWAENSQGFPPKD